MFTLTNLSVSARPTVPFNGDPVAFSFAVAERHRPFILTVSMFGGGGFFALELDTTGIRRIEAALEFGGSASLDLMVAGGGVTVMAGIYFLWSDGEVTVAGFLRASGYLSVLGIVTVTVDFYLQRLTWVAVPTGLSADGSQALLSVYVAVTLAGSGGQRTNGLFTWSTRWSSGGATSGTSGRSHARSAVRS